MLNKTIKILVAATAIGAAGCGGQEAAEEFASTEGAVLGDAIPGTNATTFAAARANFDADRERARTALGPIFNERSCGACHAERRRWRRGPEHRATLRPGRPTALFDAMESTGGSLRQLFGLGGFNLGGLNCQSGTDANPARAPRSSTRPSDDAAVRAGPGRFASRRALRHARQPRAGGDPRHRQPRVASCCQPARPCADAPAARASGALAGRPACRTSASSPLTPT